MRGVEALEMVVELVGYVGAVVKAVVITKVEVALNGFVGDEQNWG